MSEAFIAVRPAFNLNLESVLFTSNAESGKSETVGTLSENEENTGNEYKLTVKDSARIGFAAKATVISEDAITVLYKNAKVGKNEYISAIIVNADEEVTHYGKLSEVTSENGTVALNLTGVTLASTDKVYVFNEHINGDYKTDYSSDFSDIFSTVVIEGEGTEENPYLINNVKELEYFRDSVSNGNKYTGKYINLTADIDLSGRTWSPIGVNYSDFEGIFDGQNHTISNMKFTTEKNGYGGDNHLTYDYQGLFGIIRNGAIVRNFTVTGEITLAVNDQKYIGGAVGFAYEDALVSNVTSYVKITDGGTIENCCNIGNVNGYRNVGGVVGAFIKGNVKNCYNMGNVGGIYSVGGVVGYQNNIEGIIVENCYNTGSVSGMGRIGGIVGSSDKKATIKNCYNTGTVSAPNSVGGVVGLYCEVSNCYYLDACEAEETTFTSTLGTALTAEKMKNSASFTGFDFTNTWVMKSDRPILKNNPEQLFEIKSVGADGDKATVSVIILKEGTYTVAFADYENGGLNKVDIVTVTVTAEQLGENTITSSTDITLAKGDKVMLWNGIGTMTPMCNAYEIK